MYFIGDVHGKTKKLVELIDYNPYQWFQVGDMGLGFKGVYLPEFPRDKFRFIRGNHDSPQACQNHINYAGDFGYRSESELFFMGGAWSIDYKMRTPGVSWWQDEELSPEELNRAFYCYSQVKPRIVVTHEAPEAIGRILMMRLSGIGNFYYSGNTGAYVQTRTSQTLQQMFDIYQPEHWVFGHYHIDEEIDFKGTKFHCLNELSVKEIK
jgi:hypothetical protein